jgi:DNA-binding LacI/PurR family transcriptional regulator
MARPDTESRLALELIRQRLLHGDYAHRLPGERQLAGELGLSRPTVRKAISQLLEEGSLSRTESGRLHLPSGDGDGVRRKVIAFLHQGSSLGREAGLWRDGVYAAAEKRGLTVRSMAYEHDDDLRISAAFGRYDGVFILLHSRDQVTPRLMKRIQEAGTRVVGLDQDCSSLGLRSVIVFPSGSVSKLLDHLRELGHRRINCINVQVDNPVIESRIAAWQAYIDQHGIDGELCSVEDAATLGDAYRVVGERIRKGWLRRGAVLCVTLQAAIGTMRALYEIGVRIGKDVSVCVINDEGMGPYLVPSLTSLQMPARQKYVQKAVDWMAGLTEWKTPSLVQPRDARLFIGESTGTSRR